MGKEKKAATGDDVIKVTCSIEKVRYYKNLWGVVTASIDKVKEGTPKTDSYNQIVLTGIMPEPQEGSTFNIVATYNEDPKFGPQYKLTSCFLAVEFGENDEVGQKKYLSSIFTPLQVKNLYDALENPFEVLKNGDAAELVKVRDCGMKTAARWIKRFKANFYKAKIYTELEDYNLTNNMIDRLLEAYNSPEVVITTVKQNPYVLCTSVKGIGWATADKIALQGGMDKYDAKRLSAYMWYYLDNRAEQGCSWITTDELLGSLLEALGDDIPDEAITNAIRSIEDKLWYNDEKTMIGLKYYYELEQKIANELYRLLTAVSDLEQNGWEDNVSAQEQKQGWQFDEDQMIGIQTALNNNVTLIMGSAGTGKSSTVGAILNIFSKYSFAQCALAGRAASQLSEVTGQEGHTIHRLLGFPKGDADKQKFAYHDENQLEYKIYIVDEISMINSQLFYYLLRAIPSGSKVILLGDPGQLESIGSGNIAHDLMESPEIPTVILNTIHRQAARSAIITESQKVRHNQQLVVKDWTGEETRGELQDLTLHCFSDASNTYYKIMECVSRSMAEEDFNVMQEQVIVPVKSKGGACTYELNNAIQELYNPAEQKKEEITLYSDKKPYILREGDKVINTANNYRVDPPIFNGNIGVIRKIGDVPVYDEGEIVDYESDAMLIDFNGIGPVTLPREFWSSILLGYAITVHKSQGSQWNHVIFGLDFSGYSLLTNELVYTGLTRARKKCDLVAQTGALRMAVGTKSVSYKQTHLVRCLDAVAHPKFEF